MKRVWRQRLPAALILRTKVKPLRVGPVAKWAYAIEISKFSNRNSSLPETAVRAKRSILAGTKLPRRLAIILLQSVQRVVPS